MGNIGCERKAKPSKVNLQTGNPFLSLNYEEFMKYFILDKEYGVSYQTEQVLLSLHEHLELEVFCQNLHTYIQNGNVVDKVKTLTLYSLSPTNDRQLDRKIYGFLIYVLNSFLFTQLPNPPQILMKEIAVPLYKFSRVLDVKPSMGWLQHMGNWKLNGDDKFNVRNLSCRYTFTGRRDEEVFFLMSNIADFRFAIVIQEIFNVNKVLGQVFSQIDNFSQLQNLYQSITFDYSNVKQQKQRFRRQLENYSDESTDKLVMNCLKVMKEQIIEITTALKLMFEFNDPKFFYCVLRNFLKGYSEHEIFPQGLKFEEVDQIFFSEGGSGGNSPSFQIFERSLGIKFEGGFEMIQQSMRAGMMKEHKELIEVTQKYSYIRAYCDLSENQELKKCFNETIQGYINFNERHLYYISYYIEQQILALGGDPTKAIGTGSVPVTLIKDKYKMFKKFFIEA